MRSQAVVLVPGMMLDRRMYAGQLAAMSGQYTVSVADVGGAASIPALAESVLRQAPDRFALVGLSMGGIIALHAYSRAAERITHLALLGTTPHADLPERSAVRLEQIARVEAGNLDEVLRGSLKPLYLAARNRGNAGLLGAIMQMGLDLGAETFRRQSLALRDRVAVTHVLRTIRCPTLVLCGREDGLCPVDVHVAMAGAITHADLVVLADAGHLSTMEEPARVSAALLGLLTRTH